MRTVKVLIKESSLQKNGVVGNFWFPEIEVWSPRLGELSIMVKLYVNEEAFLAQLQPIGNKYIKIVVPSLEGVNFEEYAFSCIKQDSFFVGATEKEINLGE